MERPREATAPAERREAAQCEYLRLNAVNALNEECEMNRSPTDGPSLDIETHMAIAVRQNGMFAPARCDGDRRQVPNARDVKRSADDIGRTGDDMQDRPVHT